MSGIKVDWESNENLIFLNPRYPKDQQEQLKQWVGQVSDQWSSHLFLLTSGTTAKSVADLKWVALSKSAMLASGKAVNSFLKIDHRDVWLNCLPEFHVGGLGIWARAHMSGSRVEMLPKWDPHLFNPIIRKEQVTLTALVPTQVFDLVQNGIECPRSMRAVIVGGSALSEALYFQGRRLGWPLLPAFGMTETASQISTAPLESLEHIDRFPALEILSHLEVKTDSEGKFQFKGDSLLSAYIYWDGLAPQILDPKKDGWFSSQDRGRVELVHHSKRHLIFEGRNSDFIKIAGEKVEMARLRQIFDQVRIDQGISADCAVIAIPDERLEHAVNLVSDAHLTVESAQVLIDQFNSKVLGIEKIKKWHPLSALPRNDLGKLVESECIQAIANPRI